VTPVGDIELEIVFRFVVRRRINDLAHLLKALENAEAVVIWVVQRPTAPQEQSQKDVTTTAGGFSR
jgi:hypothetical protein